MTRGARQRGGAGPTRARWWAVALATALAGCAQPAASRDDLAPLFRGTAGSGEYEFDPATLPKPKPAHAPDEQRPEACDHVWMAVRDATHGYTDPLTGMPALCTPLQCATCGEVRHECLGRRGR